MLSPNTILNHTYQILRPLGEGGTSSVYLGYHLRLQKYIVIKQLHGSYSSDFLIRTEVDILKNLHHPNLPQVYDFVQEQDCVYTVIDYISGYDLEAYIKGGTEFPEQLLKRYLRQVAEVLDYLHNQRMPVIHSDIKPGNIILNQEGNAILIDFNTSIGGNQDNLLGLTLPYASPEQIELAKYAMYGQEAPFSLDPRSDLYSLGATFYELISGIRPTPGVPPAPLHTMGLTQYSHDFLVLIDRLIEYNREKRLNSAKKLVAAIDRLDSRYRTYFALRCVSLLVSAALFSGGLFCVIRGIKRADLERFMLQYQTADTLIAQGDLDRAETILNAVQMDEKMQAFLEREPEQLARLYHEIGDIHYYRESYSMAAAYYCYAVDYEIPDRQIYAAYLRDAAIACAQTGDLSKANTLLQKARENGAATEDLQLISVVIEIRSGNTAQGIVCAEQLLAGSVNPEICLRAALAVASATADPDTRIYWLELAKIYDSGKTASRGLAVAYGEKAVAAPSAQERSAALAKAGEIYEQLCSSLYASSNDVVNYSVILRMSGRWQRATEILTAGLEQDPGNYRILTNLCLAYYELGDMEQAEKYSGQALQAWKADASTGKLTESDDEIQNLLEVCRRFGIGGV